ATAGSEVDLQGQAVLTHPHQSMPMVGDDGTPVRPPSDDQLCEYELSPGDALYVPPGTWHRTQAVTRSAAISLSPPRTPVMELVTAVMTRALMADPHFRADLGGAEAATVVRERWDDLRAQLETLDPRAVHRAWAIEHERGLASLGAFVAAADTQLGPDHVVVRDPARPLRWLVADADDGTGDAVYFYGGGQEWSLPIAGLAWIQRLAIRSRFTVREAMAWAPTLGGQDALAVLTELVSAGVLSVACDPAPA
nr:cupin domain-containing protein [Deltaproteobacteria bacterium]